MSNLEFFLARAKQARAEKEAATLDNVRERCERAEAAWMEFAQRAIFVRRLQAAELQRKAEAK